MKLVTNLDNLTAENLELTKKIADFRATLLLESIKILDYNHEEKQKILNLIISKIEETLT